MIKPYKKSVTTQTFHAGHQAIDYGGSYGTPLVAPEDCTVLGITPETFTPNDYAPLTHGYGIRLLSLDGKRDWLFWHNLPIHPVSAGEKVKAGQIIAFMGNSGNVYSGGHYVPIEERTKSHRGTHLHLELMVDGQRIDPLPLLTEEPRYTVFDQMKATMVVLGKISGLISG
jgi:hypothetical protein